MKTQSKKIVSFLLALFMCVTAVFGNVGTAMAEETPDYPLYEIGTAIANTDVSYNFTVDANEKVIFDLLFSAATDCIVSVYDSAGNMYTEGTIPSVYWYYEETENGSVYIYEFTESNMPAGDYSIVFRPAADVDYIVVVDDVEPQPVLNQETATVSVGMKVTLKVDNTKEAITWKSNKEEIATVNKKGVVTGKKKGTATITATTESGVKLKCKVTVKNNKYTETKGTSASVYYGNAVVQVYSASYNSDGDLVLKCRFVNNSGYKVTALEGLKITFKTDEGKTIGTYSTSKKTMNVSHGATKDFSVKIKKSKLKIKKADLRNANYKVDGKYIYYY